MREYVVLFDDKRTVEESVEEAESAVEALGYAAAAVESGYVDYLMSRRSGAMPANGFPRQRHGAARQDPGRSRPRPKTRPERLPSASNT